MSVRKREWTTARGEAKSAWVVDYVDQAGKRRLKTFRLKKGADAFAATASVEVRAGVHTPDSASITVTEAGKAWLRSGLEDGLEPATLDQREQHIRLHIVPFLGALKLSQLAVPRVRAFGSELRQAGRSEVMVRKVITSLSGILTDAQERGFVSRNVVREVRGRRAGNGRRHRRRIEAGIDIPLPSEVKAIVAALEGRYRPLILSALFTGLRASELRGLRWEDVDLEAGNIQVRQRADKRNVIGSPKTASSRRTVPMPPLVKNVLRALRLQRGGRGLVFGTSSGRPDFVQNIVKRGWWPAQIAAGVRVPAVDSEMRPVLDGDGMPTVVAKYSGIHAARHFFASWCINPPEAGGLGLSPKAVQERLGHSSIAMTLDVYGHLFPRQDEGDRLAQAEATLLA